MRYILVALLHIPNVDHVGEAPEVAGLEEHEGSSLWLRHAAQAGHPHALGTGIKLSWFGHLHNCCGLIPGFEALGDLTWRPCSLFTIARTGTPLHGAGPLLITESRLHCKFSLCKFMSDGGTRLQQ